MRQETRAVELVAVEIFRETAGDDILGARSAVGASPRGAGLMSFQASLDAVEAKTSLTPRQIIALAHERGFDSGVNHPRETAVVGLIRPS